MSRPSGSSLGWETVLASVGAAFIAGYAIAERCRSRHERKGTSKDKDTHHSTATTGGQRRASGTEDELYEHPLISNKYLNQPQESRRDALGHSFIICVGGASGSGKTSISEIVRKELRGSEYKVVTISADSYYIPLEDGEDPSQHNFDHPEAIDFDLLTQHLRELKDGGSVDIPVYDFATHKRLNETEHIDRADVVIVDGIFTLCVRSVREICDISIFTMEDMDICLARRLKRDIEERGRTVSSVIQRYVEFVKPGFQTFVEPSMRYADIIVPRARENSTAIDIIVGDIRRRFTHERNK
eukprot:gb/GECG01002684.1/.p1 GENE.gb/GECG01002684.1/~~gb/GECG01002684.1/.p1  ORF type:complete len:299 (+),score=35.38 gb/GECG01002684.1/:1-897(+)